MTKARRRALGPWVVVAAAVAANLWDLRSTTDAVAYLDDASIHEQMVRYAAHSIGSGHLPLTGWFPYLGLGSPQFLHYQPLGAMITGLFGTAVGGDTAFRWSLYLLVSLWPAVVYSSARLFRISPWAASAAAAVSPLVASVPLVGYERGAYIWIGYGLWSQLWAQWMLPLAWATTWRALEDRRFIAPAAVSIAATIAFHFETGYLALMAVFVLPWLARPLRARLARGAALLVAAGALSLWVIVPLLNFGKWAGVNEALQGTSLVNGYGARTVLGWLFTGRVFDNGHFGVVSLAVGAGAVAAVARWRRRPVEGALVVLGVGSLLLCFGRSTFGPLVDAVPGSHDLFFRRFMLGAQLAGIYLAGLGLVEVGRGVRRVAMRIGGRLRADRAVTPLVGVAALVAAVVLCAAAMTPAFVATHRYDQRNQAEIGAQRDAEQSAAPQLDRLLGYIRAHGGGRTYAGDPSNFGADFTVGQVPVFKFIESRDIDEVGYTLRTAALMTQPEFNFDANQPADYELFGIRYLIYPAGQQPPVSADQVMTAGQYALWTLPTTGYFQVVDTVGSISEDRADVGARSESYLQSGFFGQSVGLTVAWAGAPAVAPTRPVPGAASPAGVNLAADPPPGRVISQRADPAAGSFSADVMAQRTSVVALAASFDPGWRATVDGRPAPTQMLAPAIVGVEVGPGRHTVLLRYVGYGGYWWPAAVAVAALAAIMLAWRRSSRRGPATPTTAST